MRLFKPPRLTDWVFPKLTWRFSVSKPVIFLTFDDGPNPEITPFVLDLLQSYQWKATFFCVGENCTRYPELVDRIEREGHEIGNHTMKHEHAYRVSKSRYFESFREFEDQKPVKLFRPPYGRIKPSIAREISKTHQIIMWSWLSYDYDLTVPTSKILHEAKSIKPGAILVLHDNAKIAERQRELLPKLFEQLKSDGFYSETISASAFCK